MVKLTRGEIERCHTQDKVAESFRQIRERLGSRGGYYLVEHFRGGRCVGREMRESKP